MDNHYFVHTTSIIDDDVEIGENTKIWHFSHIQSGVVIGKCCSFGQNVNVSRNVKIGNGVKVQNNVSIYEGVELGDYVFCGPSCVFTNDTTPRARYSKNGNYKKTLVEHGQILHYTDKGAIYHGQNLFFCGPINRKHPPAGAVQY